MSLYFKSEEDTMKNEISATRNEISATPIVNNHIIMAFYIDCIHTDICEQSVITRWLSAIQMVIIQIQAHSPQNTQTYMKKKGLFVQKANLAKLLPHQMTGASHAPVTRECQNSNKQSSVYLWLFFGWSHSVWDIACYKIMLFFLPPRCCFWA